MTKDELYQYYYLNLEIEQLKERIAWTDSISKKMYTKYHQYTKIKKQ